MAMKVVKKFSTKDKTSSESVHAFIDASNLWAAQKSKGKLFDYQKLVIYLKDKFASQNIRIYYYTAYPAQGTRNYSLDSRHKFFVFLEKGLGFIVRKKELKRISIISPEGEAIEEKGNMDVELTIDALQHKDKYTVAALFTGDSDFLALVTYLRNQGKKVYVFSSRNNISQELRTGGDGYFDLLNLSEDIWGKELQHKKKE